MNPGPAPRPPVDRPRLNLMPSTAGVPGNMSQLSLQSPSFQTTDVMNAGFSRSATNDTFSGVGGVRILKEGPVKCKDGLMWKKRYLILRAFQLDFQKDRDGKVYNSMQLRDVLGVTRSENTKMSFEITRIVENGTRDPSIPKRDLPQKTIIVQLENDDDIYDWIDAIYNRCPGIGGVSNPTNFSHRVHVGFDPTNGQFVGLPQEWEMLLKTSAITKEDYQKHPEAVIEVLEFYSDINKRNENPNMYPQLMPTPPVSTNQNMQLGHGGGGTAIAPPRPPPPSAGMGTLSNYIQSQRPAQNSSPSSRTGTPTQQRNFSNPEHDNKIGMSAEIRRAMDEEAHRVKAQQQEKRDRERAKQAAEEEQRNQREMEAYQASIPKARVPLAQQEIGGGYGPTDDKSYNPTRNAPPTPGTDRSRQPPQGSLRNPPTQRQAPQAPRDMNGSAQSAPRAPFAQKEPLARSQSPSGNSNQPSLRALGKQPEQRGPSPNIRVPPQDRNQTNQMRLRANGAPANGAPRAQQPPARIPLANQPGPPPAPLPVMNQERIPANDAPDPHQQAEMALTSRPAQPRQKEVRMSSMTESQVMEKLKQVVSKDDPSLSYSKQKKIGQGASGSVYVARINESAVSKVAKDLYRENSKTQVAIKQMDLRNQPRKELIVNEIIVMKESSHPNIVNFLDSFLQESNNELWVVMEFMEGGALTDVIDNNPHISEGQISSICNEVCCTHIVLSHSLMASKTCKGLAHLHSQNIIHRDIKSDNVLLDARGNVKISKPAHVAPSPLLSNLRGSPLTDHPYSRLRILRKAHRSKV